MERLLQRCLDYDPHERPSAKEVVEILTCAQLAQMNTSSPFQQQEKQYTWLLLPGLPHPQPSLTSDF